VNISQLQLRSEKFYDDDDDDDDNNKFRGRGFTQGKEYNYFYIIRE
jgi:hypothetical protein